MLDGGKIRVSGPLKCSVNNKTRYMPEPGTTDVNDVIQRTVLELMGQAREVLRLSVSEAMRELVVPASS